MNNNRFIVSPGKKIALTSYETGYTGKFGNKEETQEKLNRDIEHLTKYQDVLYAQNTYALLLIFQAMDAAGKDSVIKHVMSGVNPQGCQVYSFKQPSAEELDHDFLWRCLKALPERGRIGIFNRSYYEEVLTARVHPDILNRQQLPPATKKSTIWKERFEDINAVERHLVRNGTVILKFFLHVSKEEQKKRFIERLTHPEKNWKYSPSDLKEREYWNDYMKAYEEMVHHTSSSWAPWYIIPADHKWFARVAVADIIVETLKSMNLKYPKVSSDQRKGIEETLKGLDKEK